MVSIKTLIRKGKRRMNSKIVQGLSSCVLDCTVFIVHKFSCYIFASKVIMIQQEPAPTLPTARNTVKTLLPVFLNATAVLFVYWPVSKLMISAAERNGVAPATYFQCNSDITNGTKLHWTSTFL